MRELPKVWGEKMRSWLVSLAALMAAGAAQAADLPTKKAPAAPPLPANCFLHHLDLSGLDAGGLSVDLERRDVLRHVRYGRGVSNPWGARRSTARLHTGIEELISKNSNRHSMDTIMPNGLSQSGVGHQG